MIAAKIKRMKETAAIIGANSTVTPFHKFMGRVLRNGSLRNTAIGTS